MNKKYIMSPSCQINHDFLSDLYIKELGYKMDGYFVEIGAMDGIAFSNTYGLSLAGWSGLYVDADPGNYESCKRNHEFNKNVKIVHSIIGSENRKYQKFYCSGFWSWASSCILDDVAKARGLSENKYCLVDMMTMDNLCETYCVPSVYDLLVVDVEGYEIEVLKSYSIDKWTPKMTIIETHDLEKSIVNNEISKYSDNYFISFGYDKVYSDDINTIYVKRN